MSHHVNMQKIRYFRRDGRFFAGRLAFEENGYSILSHRAAHQTLLPRITNIGIKRYINQKRRFLVCLCTELCLTLYSTVYVPYYEPFLLDNGDVLEDVHLSEYLDEAAGLNQCGRLLIGIAPQNGGKADPDDGRHVLPFT